MISRGLVVLCTIATLGTFAGRVCADEPPLAEPPLAEPPTAEPPTAEPPTAEPPAEPPTAEPPTAEPPAEPPAAEPPNAAPLPPPAVPGPTDPGASPRGAAPPQAPPAPPSGVLGAGQPLALPNAGYDKRFFIQSSDGAYRLNIGGRVQARFTLTGREDPDTGERDTSYAFLIPRARLMMSGNFFTEDLTFAFNTEFGRGAVPANKDAVVDYRIVPEVLHVRFGQWKKPIDRQWIAAIGNLMFIERPITHPYFGTTRDIGIAIHNGIEKAPLIEYAVGVFNGTGEIGIFDAAAGKQSNIPDRVKPVIVARLGYNHGGIRPFSELDFEGGAPRFAVALGAQAFLNADSSNEGRVVTTADFVFKAYGFTTMGAAYLAYHQAEGEPFKEQRYQASGMYVSAGYLIGDVVQPGVRYARIFRAGPDNDSQEVTGGVGVHPFESPRFKLNIDGGALLDEAVGGTRTGFFVRNQLHLDF